MANIARFYSLSSNLVSNVSHELASNTRCCPMSKFSDTQIGALMPLAECSEFVRVNAHLPRGRCHIHYGSGTAIIPHKSQSGLKSPCQTKCTFSVCQTKRTYPLCQTKRTLLLSAPCVYFFKWHCKKRIGRKTFFSRKKDCFFFRAVLY